jgi:hypothetical protein
MQFLARVAFHDARKQRSISRGTRRRVGRRNRARNLAAAPSHPARPVAQPLLLCSSESTRANMPSPALDRDRIPHPPLSPRLSASQPVIPTGAARLYSARFMGDGLRGGGTLAIISIGAHYNETILTSLITRCLVQNPPFIFSNLRIAFFISPAFSKTSALPPVIFQVHPKKESPSDLAKR